MIAIIDYGIGNVGSIQNILAKIGVDSIITSDSGEIDHAEKIILPGVGSFDHGMKNLHEKSLIEVIFENVLGKRKPILGICLGMQLLGRNSEEGEIEGLGLIPFTNKRFTLAEGLKLKIPHMGWDIAYSVTENDPLLSRLEAVQRYYFVHSYHAVCDDPENVLMKCDYGYPFAAAVKKGSIYGVQFHPEKSHRFGMALLDNFARKV